MRLGLTVNEAYLSHPARLAICFDQAGWLQVLPLMLVTPSTLLASSLVSSSSLRLAVRSLFSIVDDNEEDTDTRGQTTRYRSEVLILQVSSGAMSITDRSTNSLTRDLRCSSSRWTILCALMACKCHRAGLRTPPHTG